MILDGVTLQQKNHQLFTQRVDRKYRPFLYSYPGTMHFPTTLPYKSGNLYIIGRSLPFHNVYIHVHTIRALDIYCICICCNQEAIKIGSTAVSCATQGKRICSKCLSFLRGTIRPLLPGFFDHNGDTGSIEELCRFAYCYGILNPEMDEDIHKEWLSSFSDESRRIAMALYLFAAIEGDHAPHTFPHFLSKPVVVGVSGTGVRCYQEGNQMMDWFREEISANILQGRDAAYVLDPGDVQPLYGPSQTGNLWMGAARGFYPIQLYMGVDLYQENPCPVTINISAVNLIRKGETLGEEDKSSTLAALSLFYFNWENMKGILESCAFRDHYHGV